MPWREQSFDSKRSRVEDFSIIQKFVKISTADFHIVDMEKLFKCVLNQSNIFANCHFDIRKIIFKKLRTREVIRMRVSLHHIVRSQFILLNITNDGLHRPCAHFA
ncbi:hypothetical protein D3C87_1727560 [compost metagenome]